MCYRPYTAYKLLLVSLTDSAGRRVCLVTHPSLPRPTPTPPLSLFSLETGDQATASLRTFQQLPALSGSKSKSSPAPWTTWSLLRPLRPHLLLLALGFLFPGTLASALLPVRPGTSQPQGLVTCCSSCLDPKALPSLPSGPFSKSTVFSESPPRLSPLSWAAMHSGLSILIHSQRPSPALSCSSASLTTEQATPSTYLSCFSPT